jgi:hypothetical protein
LPMVTKSMVNVFAPLPNVSPKAQLAIVIQQVSAAKTALIDDCSRPPS